MSAICGTDRPPVDRRALITLLRRLKSPEGQADPYPLLADLRAMGDVVRAPWDAYFVTGYDACSEVLRGRDWLAPDFAWQERQADTERWEAVATQEMTKTLSRLNAPEHTCQRRSLGNLFDRSTITRLTPGSRSTSPGSSTSWPKNCAGARRTSSAPSASSSRSAPSGPGWGYRPRTTRTS